MDFERPDPVEEQKTKEGESTTAEMPSEDSNEEPGTYPETTDTKDSLEKTQRTEGVDEVRRNILKTLAVASAVSALPNTTRATETTPDVSFESWKESLLRDDRSTYIEHEPVQIGRPEDDSFNFTVRGVTHIPETLIKHYEDIDREMDDSSVVMLEYFDDRNLKQLSVQEIANETARHQGELREDVEKSLYESRNEREVMSFFGVLAGMAARKEKDILVVNPDSDSARFISEYGPLAMAGPFALGTALGGSLLHMIQRENATKEDAGRKMSRRNFLKVAGLGALGVSGALSSGLTMMHDSQGSKYIRDRTEQTDKLAEDVLNKLQNAGITSKEDSIEEQVTKFYWCMNDWRDATTALSVLQMHELDTDKEESEERYVENGGNVLLVEGYAHRGVREYLQDPELAKKRIRLYNHTFNLLGDQSIRRFRYNKEEEKFDLISEVPLDLQIDT